MKEYFFTVCVALLPLTFLLISACVDVWLDDRRLARRPTEP